MHVAAPKCKAHEFDAALSVAIPVGMLCFGAGILTAGVIAEIPHWLFVVGALSAACSGPALGGSLGSLRRS